MSIALLLVVAAALTVSVMGQLPAGQSAGPTPIPSTYPQGFVYFDPKAPVPSKHNPLHTVVIEAFLDLQCPDSKASYPIITQLPGQYAPGQLFLEISLFPLPYHRNAFYAAQAAQVVYTYFVRNATTDDAKLANANYGKVFDWFAAYFEAQSSFTNVATRNLTSDQVLDKIASLAESSTGIPKDVALHGLQYGTAYDGYTRIQWKFGASRTVSGTPFFYVNGVYVTSDPSWTVDDWKTLLSSVIPSA